VAKSTEWEWTCGKTTGPKSAIELVTAIHHVKSPSHQFQSTHMKHRYLFFGYVDPLTRAFENDQLVKTLVARR